VTAPKIPDPPPVPCCDRWVESYRVANAFTGLPLIGYECGCGQALTDLQVVSDGRRQWFEWGIVHWIVGLGQGRDVVLSETVEPGPELEPAPEPLPSVPEQYAGKAARQVESEEPRRRPVFV
jgi:hypothetical protein